MGSSDSRKGLLVSLGVHLAVLLALGSAGFQAWQKQQEQDKVYTVNIVSGSPYNGYGEVPGARLGNGNPPAPAAGQKPMTAASRPQVPAVPRMTAPDAIPEERTAAQNSPAAPVPTENASPALTGSGEASSSGQAAGDPEGGSPDGVSNGGNPSGSPGEPPGPAGADGPGFDTEAVQSDVSASFLGGPAPEYPDALRNHGIQGSVRVRMIVGKDGSVESATVVSSSGYGPMDQAALDAAYGYAFELAYKEGYPVRCYATKTFTFRLN